MVKASSIRQLEILRSQLETERNSFRSHWRDLNDYILPRRGRFFVTDNNRGDRRSNKIIDSSATLAVRTLRSGMMSGVTSPARPWFKLDIADKKLAERSDVKEWLEIVSSRMTNLFIKSNLYNVLPMIYGDMGTFGTGCILQEEDAEDIMRFYPFPIGSYLISNNRKLQVDMFFRDFQMTARQIVDKFGRDPKNPGKINWDNISATVKTYHESGQGEQWMHVVHAIYPNDDHRPNAVDRKYKKFKSVYYERGDTTRTGGDSSSAGFGAADNATKRNRDNIFLRESGYDYFPVLAPRWEVTGEDVFGTDCPGMTALGDIRQLQLGEKRATQAIEKMVNPPMIGPEHLKRSKVSTLPGDITYTSEREGVQGFRPAYQVQFDINALEQKQQQIRQRISRAFFEDLFLMLAQSDRRQITAREIEERHEEKLLALGPVLEQLNQDLLDPLIDNTFAIMASRGMIPPAPEVIENADVKVEYVSIMAQAQKLAGLGGIDRFSGFISNIAGLAPAILDKIDGDKLVDIYGDITGIPNGIIRDQNETDGLREQRAQAQAAQAQAEQEAMQAQTAKDLSETSVGEGNALEELAAQSEAGL